MNEFHNYFEQNIIPPIKKKWITFRVAITKMYSQIPWELSTDPFGFAKHTLGTTALKYAVMCLQNYLFMKSFPNINFLPTSLQNVYLYMYQITTDDSIRRYFSNQMRPHRKKKKYVFIKRVQTCNNKACN